MIYDRVVSIYRLEGGIAPPSGELTLLSQHYCAPMEVYERRYWDSVQAGQSVDRMVQLPFGDDIEADMYAVYEDGHTYRIVQAQHGADRDGQPICTLSLHREDIYYDDTGH